MKLAGILLAGMLVLIGAVRGDAVRSLKQDPSGDFCVVLNEVVNKPADVGDQKGVDFLELYNRCQEVVDMAGWIFHDENKNEFVMGQNGCQHVIQGFGFSVFLRRSQCSFDFGFTKTDNVTLMDGSGLVMDFTGWTKGQADEGFSWCRVVDGDGEFQTCLPTPGVPNIAA